MKLDLDSQDSGRSELEIDGILDLDLADGRPTRAGAIGRLCVDDMENRILVTGNLSASGRAECSRCLDEFELTWKVPVEIIVLRRVDSDDGEGNSLVVCQSNGELDLESPLRECLILGYPQAPVCSEDCKGLCAQCGTNLNKSTCGCIKEEVDPRWDGLP